MRAKWTSSALVLGLLGAMFAPQAATAATCGEPESDATGAGAAKATLTLQEDSTADVSYKRSTDPKTLLLIFRVTGCELAKTQKDPDFEVVPRKDFDELPAGVITLLRARQDGTELSMRFSVDANKFKPGSYGSLIELRAPYLTLSRTPVSVSRSEDNWLVPFCIGALSGFVAILWFGLLKFFAREKLLIKWPWLIVVVIAGAIFGGLAVASSWWDQDVWSVDANLKAAIAAGVAGATTGAMLGLLGTVWQAPKKT